MPAWKYKTQHSVRHGKLFFQVNIPVDTRIEKFEIVVKKHGKTIDRATFWDSYDTPEDAITQLLEYHE